MVNTAEPPWYAPPFCFVHLSVNVTPFIPSQVEALREADEAALRAKADGRADHEDGDGDAGEEEDWAEEDSAAAAAAAPAAPAVPAAAAAAAVAAVAAVAASPAHADSAVPVNTPRGGCAETPAQAKRKAAQLEERLRTSADQDDEDLAAWLEPEDAYGNSQEEDSGRAPRSKRAAPAQPTAKKGKVGKKGGGKTM
jgi:hypothetical protein